MTSALAEISIYQPTYSLQQSRIVLSRYINSETDSGDFPVTDSCERSATVMGDDYVKLSFKLLGQVVFDAFAFIYYDSQLFFLKEQYRPTSKGSYYQYDMKFVSVANMLSKHMCMRYLTVGGVPVSPEPEININATLGEMAVILIDSIHGAASRENANQANNFYAFILNGMTIANDMKQNTSLQTFSFSGMNISDVLTSIAETYEIEWWVSQENQMSVKLHLCKCEVGDTLILSDRFKSTGNNLQPYESRGLLSCEYSQEWSNVPQKIIPFGSDRNITRKQALQTINGCDMYVSYGKQLRLAPNTPYTVTDRDGNSVQKTTDAIGAFTNTAIQSGIETIETFEDIYPRCHFRVLGVTVKGTDNPIYTITAAAIKADGTSLMSYAEMVADGLLPLNIEPNETLSIIFESGYLNGREFEVAYDIKEVNGMVQWSLTIVPEEDGENGVSLPFGNFVPRAMVDGGYEGDMFAIFHMIMPEAYVTRAQEELAQAAYEKLLAIEDTRPEVKCKSEPIFFANKSLSLGWRVGVHSELFGNIVEEDGEIAQDSPSLFLSRVTSFSHSLTKPNEVEFKLASARVNGTLTEMAIAIAERTNDIRGLEQRSVNLSRRGWHDAAEMRNMLDSLAAEMMLVGVEKNQFAFTSKIECVNGRVVLGVNHFLKLQVSAGYIQHTQEPYIKYSNGGRWAINAADLTQDANNNTLESQPAVPFYLYAICTSNSNTAQLILSSTSRDNDASCLLLGILSAEFNDETTQTSFRTFNRTNGYTQIAGGTITTEQIQDPTRSLIIDFSSNPPRIIATGGAEIIGKIKFKVGNSTVEGIIDGLDNRVTIVENTMATQALLESIREDLQRQIDGAIDTWFYEGAPTLNNLPASGWQDDDTKDLHLGDLYYDKQTGFAYRFLYDDEHDIYLWSLVLDNDIATALERAAKAQETADGKMTFFHGSTPPNPPYQVGDVWDKGGTGEIWYATTTRTTGSYVQGDWVSASEYVKGLIAELSTIVGTKAATTYVDGIKNDLQNQIDGKITSWFYNVAPGDSVPPESTWKATDIAAGNNNERLRHVGDMYYNKTTGYGYRYTNNGTDQSPVFAWERIKDSDIVSALNAAQHAQETADGKLTVFSSQPVPPYEVGDIWQKGQDGELLYAIVRKTENESFSINDWVSSSKYIESLMSRENLIGEGRTCSIGDTQSSNEYFYIPLVGDLSTIDGSNNSAVNHALLEPNTKYVFSFEQAIWQGGAHATSFNAGLFWKDGNNVQHVDLKTFNLDYNFDGVHERVAGAQSAVFETPALPAGGTKCAFIAYAGIQGQTANKLILIKKMMLQVGERPSNYLPYVNHLVNALKGTTEIDGGLLMTNVLMLKNENDVVSAGLSGLVGTPANPERVLLWGGATYEQAEYAAKDSNYKKSASGTPITTLIKKDGTGKIGCFQIDDDSILIKAGDNKIYITNKDINLSGVKVQTTKSGAVGGARSLVGENPKATESGNTFSQIEFSIGINADGRYKALIPAVSIDANYSVISYNSQSGQDNGYAEAYLSYNLQVRIVNIWTDSNSVQHEDVLYSSGAKELDDFGGSNDSGGGTDGGRPAQTQTIPAFETIINAKVGTLRIELFGSYWLSAYAEEENYQHGASYANVGIVATTSEDAVVVGIEKYCVVAKNGIAVISNSDSQFYVKNDSNSNLELIAKGLPETAPSTPGQLYRSGSYIKIVP